MPWKKKLKLFKKYFVQIYHNWATKTDNQISTFIHDCHEVNTQTNLNLFRVNILLYLATRVRTLRGSIVILKRRRRKLQRWRKIRPLWRNRLDKQSWKSKSFHATDWAVGWQMCWKHRNDYIWVNIWTRFRENRRFFSKMKKFDHMLKGGIAVRLLCEHYKAKKEEKLLRSSKNDGERVLYTKCRSVWWDRWNIRAMSLKGYLVIKRKGDF